MEALAATFNKIVNTSACDENSVGIICEHCNKHIPPMKLDIPVIGERWVQPTCECYQKIEQEKLRLAENHQKQMEIKRLFAISDLGEKFQQTSIDNFIVREGSEAAYKITRKYIDNFLPDRPNSLLLWGTYGNGKSHLATAVANGVEEKGHIVVFQSTPELLRRIRNTFNKEEKETEHQIIKALLECDLLILDDIGSEKMTDWVENVFNDIIDGRYRRKKPTLATTNLDQDELRRKIGRRAYSRFEETCLFIENKATSYRTEIAKARLEKVMEDL